MLAFGALIDLSLAPLEASWVSRLRQALPAMPGRVVVATDAEVATVHMADTRPLPYDGDLPLRDGELFVAGTLRVDAQAALRAALSRGAPMALDTASDARLVALAYRQWGDRLAEHLLGDYAFVVWDRAARRLVWARDPHGNRTLFWARAGSVIAIGSSIELVRSLPGVTSTLHEPAVRSLLRDGWVDEDDRTVYRDVRRVSAAHSLVASGTAAPAARRHWSFPVPAPIRYRRDQEYAEHFLEVLGDAVRDRLRAPAALLLSGGMDSSTLAVTALRAAPGVPMRAFTMTYPTLAPSDDDTLSVEVARHLGLAHTLVNLDGTRALRHLGERDGLAAQPLDESELSLLRESLVPLADFAPIAIDGEDGDWLLQAPTLLGQLRTQPVAEVIGSWARYWWRTGQRPWVGLDWRGRLRRWRHGGAPTRAPWMRGDTPAPAIATASGQPGAHPLRPLNVRALSSPLWDMSYEMLSPTNTRQPILHTMPLVDPRVFAFVFALPPVPWCQDKHLFRYAMRASLPPAVLTRPKTPLGGFIEARVAQWRAEGGGSSRVSDRVAPWVDVDEVQRIFREGSPYEVIEAWRVLQVDRWLAREEGQGA